MYASNASEPRTHFSCRRGVVMLGLVLCRQKVEEVTRGNPSDDEKHCARCKMSGDDPALL